jgi:LruC domain-containing protein
MRGASSFHQTRRGLLLALLVAALPAIAAAADSDGDGVPDSADAFPCDGLRAGITYFPGFDSSALLSFEDQWPGATDLDFNDVTVRAHYRLETDPAGDLVTLRAVLDPVALGGELSNGLALQVPAGRQGVSARRRVAGGAWQPLTLEGDANATVIISQDLRELYGNPSGAVNSRTNRPRLTGQRLELEIDFVPGATLPIGDAPFDLFIFRAGDFGHQIHFPQYAGTAAMKASLFYSEEDGSDATRRFVHRSGVPAALNLMTTTRYPHEAVPVSDLFPDILAFASSRGAQNQSFYAQNVVDAKGHDVAAPALPPPPNVDTSCVVAPPSGAGCGPGPYYYVANTTRGSGTCLTEVDACTFGSAALNARPSPVSVVVVEDVDLPATLASSPQYQLRSGEWLCGKDGQMKTLNVTRAGNVWAIRLSLGNTVSDLHVNMPTQTGGEGISGWNGYTPGFANHTLTRVRVSALQGPTAGVDLLRFTDMTGTLVLRDVELNGGRSALRVTNRGNLSVSIDRSRVNGTRFEQSSENHVVGFITNTTSPGDVDIELRDVVLRPSGGGWPYSRALAFEFRGAGTHRALVSGLDAALDANDPDILKVLFDNQSGAVVNVVNSRLRHRPTPGAGLGNTCGALQTSKAGSDNRIMFHNVQLENCSYGYDISELYPHTCYKLRNIDMPNVGVAIRTWQSDSTLTGVTSLVLENHTHVPAPSGSGLWSYSAFNTGYGRSQACYRAVNVPLGPPNDCFCCNCTPIVAGGIRVYNGLASAPAGWMTSVAADCVDATCASAEPPAPPPLPIYEWRYLVDTEPEGWSACSAATPAPWTLGPASACTDRCGGGTQTASYSGCAPTTGVQRHRAICYRYDSTDRSTGLELGYIDASGVTHETGGTVRQCGTPDPSKLVRSCGKTCPERPADVVSACNAHACGWRCTSSPLCLQANACQSQCPAGDAQCFDPMTNLTVASTRCSGVQTPGVTAPATCSPCLDPGWRCTDADTCRWESAAIGCRSSCPVGAEQCYDRNAGWTLAASLCAGVSLTGLRTPVTCTHNCRATVAYDEYWLSGTAGTYDDATVGPLELDPSDTIRVGARSDLGSAPVSYPTSGARERFWRITTSGLASSTLMNRTNEDDADYANTCPGLPEGGVRGDGCWDDVSGEDTYHHPGGSNSSYPSCEDLFGASFVRDGTRVKVGADTTLNASEPTVVRQRWTQACVRP